MQTKCCSKCARDLPLDAFNRYHRGTHGRQAYCKECAYAYQCADRATPEGQAKLRAKSKRRWERVKTDPQLHAKALADHAAYRDRNRDLHNVRANARRNKDPERMRVQSARTRAKLYGVENTLTLSEWLAVLEEKDRRCIYCGGPFEAMDHIVPLSQGGANCAENVAPACRRCNCSKHASDKPRTRSTN